jgi:two-component system, OmpR family, sensor histidine kinase KdpD
MTFRTMFGRTARAAELRFLGQCAIGIVAIRLVIFLGIYWHFNLATSGFVFLLTVVLVALYCGFWQATVVSIVALLSQDYYFVVPLHTLYIADPQNVIALVVFECTALIVSRLSAREERHAREAEEQRNNLQKLYELSRRTLSLDLHRMPGPKVLQLIVEIFAVDAVAIFDADLDAIDTWGSWPTDVKELARNTCHFEINQDGEQGISRRVLRLGTVPIGAIVLRGKLRPLTIDAIASLLSITFDRYRSFANETRAEAAHQSEQLRTTVLDQLAHAFKTPLTAIRTASAGLVEIGGVSPVQADLAALIEEQSVLLSDLTTRLLQTARLEVGEITFNTESVAIAEMIDEVVAEQSGQIGDHPLKVLISDRGLGARGDRELLATIVRQFVDNAAKYSYPGTTIAISAQASASEILISVHNEGDAIRLQDRERIFERFYRCPETRDRVPGTGIGLSIAKRAAEAHNGHVWVISGKEEGTTFFLSIQGDERSGR